MKPIMFSIFLILVAPTFVFSSEADNIIKQQKENKRKESEVADKRKKHEEAMELCSDKVTEVIALKVKELMDKGVEFKKPVLYNDSFENIGGKWYAVYVDGVYGTQKTLVRTRMYEGKFIALQPYSRGGGITIYFQPKNGKVVNVTVSSVGTIDTFEWELRIFGRNIKFKSGDIDEIEKKQDKINEYIVKAIEAAIKYGDK